MYDRIWQSPLKARSYGLSARITKESTPQGRRNLGAALPGHERGRQNGSRTSRPSDLSGNFRRIRTHGARWTGLGLGFESTTLPALGRASFHFLAEHYLKADFGADAVRPKSAEHHPHRGALRSRLPHSRASATRSRTTSSRSTFSGGSSRSHETDGLAWTTIAKMRGIMLRIYKIGIRHEHVTKNPVLHVETRSKTNYRAIVITPAQTLAILKSLPSPLHFTLVLTCAATALRASEMLALRWADMYCGMKDGFGFPSAGPRVRTEKRRRMRRTDMSRCIRFWPRIFARGGSKRPTRRTTDFVFPSMKAQGQACRSPLLFSSPIICDRPQRKPECDIEDGQRFGLHNLRHSLSNWLVNKAKVEPKTVQGILRHSEDSDDARSVHAGRQR